MSTDKKLVIDRLTVFLSDRMSACITYNRAGMDHSILSSRESIRELLEMEMKGLENKQNKPPLNKPQPPKDCDHLWEQDTYQRSWYAPYDYIFLTCSLCGATKEVMN